MASDEAAKTKAQENSDILNESPSAYETPPLAVQDTPEVSPATYERYQPVAIRASVKRTLAFTQNMTEEAQEALTMLQTWDTSGAKPAKETAQRVRAIEPPEAPYVVLGDITANTTSQVSQTLTLRNREPTKGQNRRNASKIRKSARGACLSTSVWSF